MFCYHSGRFAPKTFNPQTFCPLKIADDSENEQTVNKTWKTTKMTNEQDNEKNGRHRWTDGKITSREPNVLKAKHQRSETS